MILLYLECYASHSLLRRFCRAAELSPSSSVASCLTQKIRVVILNHSSQQSWCQKVRVGMNELQSLGRALFQFFLLLHSVERTRRITLMRLSTMDSFTRSFARPLFHLIPPIRLQAAPRCRTHLSIFMISVNAFACMRGSNTNRISGVGRSAPQESNQNELREEDLPRVVAV
jgi:hypothetical protein